MVKSSPKLWIDPTWITNAKQHVQKEDEENFEDDKSKW
jgi:hypothetical protein